MLSKRSGAGAAVGDGKIYVCGGWDGREPLRTVERYTMLHDSWELVSEMHCKRARGLGVAHFGGDPTCARVRHRLRVRVDSFGSDP